MITGKLERMRRSRLKAVLARKHQVEHDQIRPTHLQRSAQALAIRRGCHPVALLLQVLLQKAAGLGVVVDDQDVVLTGHGGHITAGGRFSAAKL
jgi:hypothetical protein